jgi:hypothetical protein
VVGQISLKGPGIVHPLQSYTLESVIDIGQGISVEPGRFGKKNKHRALNKRRAWKIWKKE